MPTPIPTIAEDQAEATSQETSQSQTQVQRWSLNIFDDVFGGDMYKGSSAEIELAADKSDSEAEVVEVEAPEAPAAEAEAPKARAPEDQAQASHSPVASDMEHRNDGNDETKDETKTRQQEAQQKNLRASGVAKPSVVKKPIVPSLPSPSPLEKWKHVYTIEDAWNGVWNKPTQVIGDLLLAQSALLVSAQPHSMKSLAWLQAALEAAARQKVWDYFPAPDVTKTLFIETEDPEWLLQERIRGLAKGLGIPENEKIPGFHWVCPGPFDLVNDKGLDMLLDALRPDFAVISTLQNIIPGKDLNDAKAMAPVNKRIIELTRKICPIVMITHSTWDPQNKRAIGTITQTANYATTLHFEKKSGDFGDFVDATLDSKLGSKEKFQLRLETEEVPFVDKDGVEKKTEVRRLVYKPQKSSSKKAQVEAAVKRLGPSASVKEIACEARCTERHARDVIKGLVDDKKNRPKKGAEGSPHRKNRENSSAGSSAGELKEAFNVSKAVPRVVPRTGLSTEDASS